MDDDDDSSVEQVKRAMTEDKGSKSMREKVVELKHKGQEKLAPMAAAAKEKVEGKRPAIEQAKEMIDSAKHTASSVVKQESKDVVEGVKRLARDEQAFHNAAHKIAEKVITKIPPPPGQRATVAPPPPAPPPAPPPPAAPPAAPPLPLPPPPSAAPAAVAAAAAAERVIKEERNELEAAQQHHTHFAHHIPDFSDFSELEDEGEGNGEEGTSNQRHHNHHHHHHHHQQKQQQPQQEQQHRYHGNEDGDHGEEQGGEHGNKREKGGGPLSYFKVSGKHGDKGKLETEEHSRSNQDGASTSDGGGGDGGTKSGVLGVVKNALGGGGDSALDRASDLAQRKLADMKHVVEAQMDDAGIATAAEKKTQGLGLVQSFVCLCTCASSVKVSG